MKSATFELLQSMEQFALEIPPLRHREDSPKQNMGLARAV